MTNQNPSPESNSNDINDINELLDFAENLKKNCDLYIDRIEQLVLSENFFFLLIIALFFLLFTFTAFIPSELELTIKVNIIFLLFSLTTYSLMIESQINKIKRKLFAEQKALANTVDLLREMGQLFWRKQKWTDFKNIEFRIKLSRYDIGEYKTPRTFLSMFAKLPPFSYIFRK